MFYQQSNLLVFLQTTKRSLFKLKMTFGIKCDAAWTVERIK